MGMQQSISNRDVVTGADALIAQFERLSQAVQGRIGKKVVEAGIKVLVAAGRDATPSAQTPGHDNRAIRNAIRGRLTGTEAGGVVRGKVGFNVGRYTAPHAHLYVLGTQQRTVRGRLSGSRPASRGRMPAHDYFAPAMQAAEAEALAVMDQVFAAEIAAEVQ